MSRGKKNNLGAARKAALGRLPLGKTLSFPIKRKLSANVEIQRYEDRTLFIIEGTKSLKGKKASCCLTEKDRKALVERMRKNFTNQFIELDQIFFEEGLMNFGFSSPGPTRFLDENFFESDYPLDRQFFHFTLSILKKETNTYDYPYLHLTKGQYLMLLNLLQSE